jgi:hypothetical protein
MISRRRRRHKREVGYNEIMANKTKNDKRRRR